MKKPNNTADTNWRSNLVNEQTRIENFCQILEADQGVHKHEDGTWWWYDETQADEFGGYITKNEAVTGLAGYYRWLLKGKNK